MDALSVKRFVVGDGRIGCDVALAPHAPRTTTPTLAAHVRAAFPDLPSHACVNGAGDTFGAVMEATSLPHMLEHLVIDLQTRAAPAGSRPDVVYVGVTRWTDESAGRAHIEVSFTDDLVALRAFRDAARFLNAAVVTCSP
ncbi:cyanophycin synthetase family protein [Gordonibacter massiliensis (ex Traore et al. 2017)]|uniref:cyanophycin synthetase family protein n=1 Tax=Gordonibacter massiliensis (ex Traore et al. 2017) TaxID=1841863 RepID=UPI001C8B9B3A|nr:hypothetical protein [Gordonibacter massiliensis (ex Traore et al. 2017)]